MHRTVSQVRRAVRSVAFAGLAILTLSALKCPTDNKSSNHHGSIQFVPDGKVILGGQPHLEGGILVQGMPLGHVQFQVGASPWMPAHVDSVSPTQFDFVVALGGLPVGTHVVRLRSHSSSVTVTDSATITVTAADALAMLQQLGVIPNSSLGTQSVARANFAAIAVRLFDQEVNAQLMQGVTYFQDVPASHWATGFIAIYKALMEGQGYTVGTDPGGTLFSPNASMTAPEVAASLAKLLGMRANHSLSWPENWVRPIEAAGLIPPPMTAQTLISANAPTTLESAAALAYQAWTSYVYPDGRTPGQAYLDAMWRKW